jgi:hypothetical protein
MIRPENMSRTLALLVLFCFLPVQAFANAGKIIFAQGEVAVIDADDQRMLVDTGYELEEGDRIKTGAEARTQIRLSDGALISLRANSDYQIVAQKTGKGLMEQAGKLFSGWMRTVTGAIGDENPEAVKQETPVATIGIRGTTYQVIHMPEGGIPGLPESEPGTYIYLQQGRIESTAGGKTRFLEPGDVVYVPLGGVPVPAPGKKKLFSENQGKKAKAEDGRRLEILGENESEDREDLESTDAINDGLIDILPDTQPPSEEPFSFTNTGAVAHYYDSDGVTQELAVDPSTVQLDVFNGEDALVTVEGQNSFSSTVTLTANQGASPVQTGSVDLSSGSDRINWGIWDQPDYQVIGGTKGPGPDDQWHYMIGSNTIQTYTELANMGLSGQWNYGYKGGTTLQGAGGLDINSGNIVVDFDSMGLDVTLSASNGTTYNSGAFTINDLYNNSVSFSNGQMTGFFTGENADGIISTVTLEGNTGTAAFGRDGTTSQTVSAP